MKKLIILAALAFALLAGTVTVVAVYPHQAKACEGNGCK